jgi:hypothetical protein
MYSTYRLPAQLLRAVVPVVFDSVLRPSVCVCIFALQLHTMFAVVAVVSSRPQSAVQTIDYCTSWNLLASGKY